MKTENVVKDGAIVEFVEAPGVGGDIPGGNSIGIDAGLGRMDDADPRDRDNTDGPRCGGAIMAASGSLASAVLLLRSSVALCGVVIGPVGGGAANVLASSAGSSPGITHTLNFSL